MIGKHVICKRLHRWICSRPIPSHHLADLVELLICNAQATHRCEVVLAKHHWFKVGDIPNYFRTVTGNFYDCAIYYKSIEPTQELYV